MIKKSGLLDQNKSFEKVSKPEKTIGGF